MPSDAATQTSLSNWDKAFGEISAFSNQIRGLIRIANHTNQLAVARDLWALLKSLPGGEIAVTIASKPENGAALLAQRLQVPQVQLRLQVLEAPAYSDFTPEVLSQAKASAAILFVVNPVAPFFDETLELIGREFAAVRSKLLLVALSDSSNGAGSQLERAAVLELTQALSKYPNLAGIAVCDASGLVDGVLHLLFHGQILGSVPELRKKTRLAAQALLPFAKVFAEFLSLTPQQYLRRLEFIHRDLESLTTLANRAKSLLSTQTQKSMNDCRSVLQALTASMRQQAEAAVHNTPIPRETLAAVEARTQFGKSAVGNARAAAYREFDMRIQALAMDLNSARSVLLSSMDEIRVEAQAHLEELVLNLGPGLLPIWLAAAAPAWAATPLDFSLDPGTGFPDRVVGASRQVRGGIAEPQFASAWASRIESLFKGEMATAACANWTPALLDQPLTASLALLWKETTERSCGLLIGRISMIVEAIESGILCSRLGSLQLPEDPKNRTASAEAFRGFAAQLERTIQTTEYEAV